MRAFLLSASFWGGSWGLAYSVEDNFGLADTNIVSQLKGLELEDQIRVIQMATDLKAANAATLEDNVASILALLNRVHDGYNHFGTLPYYNPYTVLGRALALMFTDASYNSSSAPPTTSSYLYKIFQSINGGSIPSGSSAIVPLLSRIEAAITNFNAMASAVGGGSNVWTTANVLDLMQYLDQIEWHGYNNGMSVDTIRTILLANGADPTIFETAYYDSQRDPTLRVGFGYDAHTFLDGIKSAIVGSVNTGSSDIVQAVNALALALDTLSGNFDSWVVNQGQSSADVVNYLSGMAFDVTQIAGYLDTISSRDYSGQLDSIDSHIVDGNNELQQIREDQLGYGSGESQRDFFWDLMHNELGFSDNRTTAFNMMTQIVQRISYDQAIADAAGTYVTNSLMAVATNGVRDLDKTEEDTLKQIDDYTKDEENQPDWEQQKYTGSNPADQLDDVFANGIEAQLDPLLQFGANVEGDTRIELYRGQFPIFGGVSATRSSRGPVTVPLDISYSLRDNDEVSLTILTIGTFMEYLWDIVFLALSGWMILRFWDWLASSRGHSSLE